MTDYDEVMPNTRFKRETNRVLRICKKQPYTVLVTIAGKPSHVFIDTSSYESAMKVLEKASKG
ncbi:hypothetical protein L4C54_23165 [Vibrio lamellibrachiae]|uniref:hypothetical protein n=1 Tax=Vibrio lamellibrachiae TaxID=2910253 RepID=UPI003D100D34